MVFIDPCTLTWEPLCFSCGVFTRKPKMYDPESPITLSKAVSVWFSMLMEKLVSE